jgi:hypothetical protein
MGIAWTSSGRVRAQTTAPQATDGAVRADVGASFRPPQTNGNGNVR